jgi:hypothetical protein
MLGDIQEIRLYAEVHGQLISGQPDLIREGKDGALHLADWKFTSRWATLEGVKIEWEAQLNLYRWLCYQNRDLLLKRGMDYEKITELTLYAWYKDWTNSERRKRGDDYPPFQIEVFPVDMWDLPVAEAYVHGRVDAHLEAEKRLPECTPTETWSDPDKWALTNSKGKCIKLHLSEMDAEAHRLEMAQSENYTIEYRKGRPKRCEDGWCPVAPFCSQYQAQFEPTMRQL